MIAAGELGEIRMVHMQFAHGFHSAPVEAQSEATKWRVDPRLAGPSYVLGDVGSHPLYLSEVMLPELKIKKLLCVRQSFVKSRAPLEDNAYTLMEYEGGAMGYLWSSAYSRPCVTRISTRAWRACAGSSAVSAPPTVEGNGSTIEAGSARHPSA
jgi:predicted dehydrogenase